jgi:hypothetical protein
MESMALSKRVMRPFAAKSAAILSLNDAESNRYAVAAAQSRLLSPASPHITLSEETLPPMERTMHPTDDGDDAFFEWALAHFRQNPVVFSDLPADSLPDEDAAARRKRLDRLN